MDIVIKDGKIMNATVMRNGILQDQTNHREQTNRCCTVDTESRPIEKLVVRPIDRTTIFSQREEWEQHFGGVRVSLEALHKKKKKQGGPKLKYSDFAGKIITEPGPYYDPYDMHLHIWKKGINIKGLICEQNQTIENIEYTDSDKNDVFCSICHKKKMCQGVKPRLYLKKPIVLQKTEIVNERAKETFLDKWGILYYRLYWKNELNKKNETVGEKTTVSKFSIRWYKIVYKLLYKPILYNISPKESLLLYPWQFTPYQNFKLNNPDYKDNVVFLNHERKFYNNYVTID